jgi:hypothetical protein
MWWVFLIPVAVLGILTSYEDIRFGKIRNIYTFGFFISAILANIFLFALGIASSQYFISTMINTIIALAVSFCLWWTRVWSAGDAKLFTAYSALVPLVYYSNNDVSYFPSMIVLINTFVPVFLVNLVTMIGALREIKISAKEIGAMVLAVFGLSWLSRIIVTIFGLSANYVSIIVLTYLLFWLIKKIRLTKSNNLIFMVSLCLLRIIVDRTIFSLDFLKMFIIITVGFGIITLVMRKTFDALYVKQIKSGSLKQGMVIEKGIIKNKTKFSIENGAEKQKDYLVESTPEGLTKADIDLIKKNLKKLEFKTIPVLKTIPFAPLLFFGVIITIIAKGVFVSLIW